MQNLVLCQGVLHICVAFSGCTAHTVVNGGLCGFQCDMHSVDCFPILKIF